ncbi:Hypothetical protein A7982_09075 [Minicystis rosea]|nr:Hypothetical protein A7982_09075 [Minicystis rosea]
MLYAAITFYGSLHRQTHGVWSAPLDDVFIHFDYARAIARGYPFEWSEGNGFSSGNTSIAYPFVLAFGYLVGFRGASLMVWAAIVACISTLGFLLAAARLTEPLGRWAKYFVPPAVLSLGALDWSLWSGMENAFHLGVWALALTATLAIVRAAGGGPEAAPPSAIPSLRLRGWLAGLACALLFLTRPESVVCIMAFAVVAALAARRAGGNRAALATVLRVGIPGALALVAQSVLNRVFTGEWSANGAIAKLGMNDPYMPGPEKWDEYLFLLKYVVVRNTHHHFVETPPGAIGWSFIVPAVAAVPLFDKRTRPHALLLWVSAIGWLLLVAMNRQVRWQNERYTMSAVAWVLVLFAMGFGVIVSRVHSPRVAAWLGPREPIAAALRGAVALFLALAFWKNQLPQMRDQIWFFGRASRNINDQHIAAGRKLAKLGARRVLVGDAGALMYASDLPGLDIIGLGGYHDLPFARAGVHGLGASLELVERMHPADRPDVMAIYPSWWGDLPTLFGKRIEAVPVYGNVICGGAEKVLYRADWSPLDRSGKPRVIEPGERIVDELDVADLLSEKAHRYVFPHPAMGFVDFHVLGDVLDPKRDLFDAGRVIPAGQSETARVRAPKGGGRLVVRTSVSRDLQLEVKADGRPLGKLTLAPGKGWIEPALALPAGLPERFDLTLTPIGGEWLDCHVWILEGAGEAARGAR